MEIATFTCSICGESSRDICVFCTKDACRNHLCERCKRCSDCCECDARGMDFGPNAGANARAAEEPEPETAFDTSLV